MTGTPTGEGRERVLDATATGQRTRVSVRLCVLGPVRAWHVAGDIEVEIALGGPKQRAVLAVLALAGGRSVSRDAIIDFVWGDAPPPRVSATVQTYVATLRQALEPGRATSKTTRTQSRLLLSRGGGYQLNTDSVAIDLLHFRELVTGAYAARQTGDLAGAAAQLTKAIALRSGPFLDDLGGALRLHPGVAAIEQEYLGTAVDCADAQLQVGLADEVLGWLPELAAAEPTSESLQIRLMGAYAQTGQPARALEVYERTRRQLAEEFGIGPGRELQQAHLALLHADEEIAQQRKTIDLSELLPVRRWIGRPPDQRALVGRDQVLPELIQLIQHHRVVTMVGPGGAGKTALALATARTALDTAVGAASDGVVVVECGRLPAEPDSGPEESSGLVAEALRSAIDARPNGRESALGAVVRVLQGERRLVVLDNAEHVRASCNRLVDQLVRSCPSLRIVVTSRRQLGLPLETVWEVEPLALPAENETRGAELLASPAVQLFVELARLIRRGIDTDSQLPAIARICRHVEGLPLAIELATARLRAMSIADLAVRLEASAAVISAGSDHRLPHQRALKATYEWSAQLLPPAERRLLARLAVFPTSFELTAAERVCGHSGTDSEDIPVLLGNLVDHSMIQVIDEGDQLRYRLLIPIREFAADGTDEADLDITRRRHLDWCASVLAAINETIDDEQRTIQISAVRGEMDNIYAALGWALDRDDEELTEVSAELLAAARPVFDSDYGKLQTARHYTHRALSRWDTMSPEVHGRLRHWAGRLAYLQGRPLEARSHLETALALLRGKSADIYRLRLDIGLGIAACRYVMVDPGCLDIVDNCLVNAEAVGDSELLASILADAASFSTHWGQMSRAESFFRRAQALAEPNGTVNFRIQYRLANYFLMTGNPQKSVEISGKLLYDPTGISASRAIETQAYHGWAHARLGDFETGRDHLRQSLELALGRPLDRTYILLASADLERLAGDLGKSAKYLRSSLTASLGFSDLHTAVLAVWLTAALAESLDPEQASSVVALALACRRITQLPAWPLDDETFDSWAEMERQIGRDSSVPDRDHDVIVHAAEQCRLLLASWDGR